MGTEIGIDKRSINYITLIVFAPVLVLVGVAGFLIPAKLSLTSGKPRPVLFFALSFQ